MQQSISYQLPTEVPIALSVIIYCLLKSFMEVIYCGVVGLMQFFYYQMIGSFKRITTTTTTIQKHFHRCINRWHCVCNKNINLGNLINMRNNMHVIMMGKFIFLPEKHLSLFPAPPEILSTFRSHLRNNKVRE